MIKIDENDPIGEVDPSFPFRDVMVKRGTDVKQFYDLQEEIGRGKFGTVYRCREKSTGLKLAAKCVNIANRQNRRNAEREVEVMRELQHPRLIQIYDAYEYNNIMCVILELIEGGELFERVIDDDFILTEKAVTVFMRQICEGIDFIHSRNIIHLDMKPENILCLTRTGNRIKIIDFGLARKYDPDKKLQVLFGTPEFVAPEVVNFDSVGFGTDMWSVGVICYVLLSGLSPFMGETDVATMANVTIAQYDFDDEAFNDISEDAKDFIRKLLVKDRSARMSASECLKHQWLQRKSPPPPLPPPIPTESPSEISEELGSQKDNLKHLVERWNDEQNIVPFALNIEQSKAVMNGNLVKIPELESKSKSCALNKPLKTDIAVLEGPNKKPKLEQKFPLPSSPKELEPKTKTAKLDITVTEHDTNTTKHANNSNISDKKITSEGKCSIDTSKAADINKNPPKNEWTTNFGQIVSKNVNKSSENNIKPVKMHNSLKKTKDQTDSQNKVGIGEKCLASQNNSELKLAGVKLGDSSVKNPIKIGKTVESAKRETAGISREPKAELAKKSETKLPEKNLKEMSPKMQIPDLSKIKRSTEKIDTVKNGSSDEARSKNEITKNKTLGPRVSQKGSSAEESKKVEKSETDSPKGVAAMSKMYSQLSSQEQTVSQVKCGNETRDTLKEPSIEKSRSSSPITVEITEDETVVPKKKGFIIRNITHVSKNKESRQNIPPKSAPAVSERRKALHKIRSIDEALIEFTKAALEIQNTIEPVPPVIPEVTSRRVSDITSLSTVRNDIDVRSPWFSAEVQKLSEKLREIAFKNERPEFRPENRRQSADFSGESRRPKFRITYLNRDVPFGSNSANYRNLFTYIPATNAFLPFLKPTSFHSDPSSPRLSPERCNPSPLTREILTRFFNELDINRSPNVDAAISARGSSGLSRE